jgi:hypothetical protein
LHSAVRDPARKSLSFPPSAHASTAHLLASLDNARYTGTAGIQMGYECWCSNYKGTHGPPAPPNQCNTICTDAGQKCGGFCRMTEFYIECSCTSYDVNTGQGVCNGVHVNVGAVICGAGFDRSKCVAVQASPNGEKRRKKNPQPPSLRAHALRAFVEFCCTTLSAPTYALTHAPALTLVLLKEALRRSSSITHARPCPHPCAADVCC